MKEIGLYVHIPFCRRKCPYCDFYSLEGQGEAMDAYPEALLRDLSRFAAEGWIGAADTIYLGGGTPSLLGAGRLCRLLDGITRVVGVSADAEISLEANPESVDLSMLRQIRSAGFNRISFGVQSLCDRQLSALGRLHDAGRAKDAVQEAKTAGFLNLSVDLMLGTPYETEEALGDFADWASEERIPHLSAYLLKREPGTPYATADLPFCDDDAAADRYLFICGELAKAGYGHYEISNFARPGFESRHNLKYWRCEDYLGLGPSAHSFIGGRRFSTPPALDDYLRAAGHTPWERTFEPGGDADEALMLALRLKEGLHLKRFEARFGRPARELLELARPYLQCGWAVWDGEALCLTERGMLVSNTVIVGLLSGGPLL